MWLNGNIVRNIRKYSEIIVKNGRTALIELEIRNASFGCRKVLSLAANVGEWGRCQVREVNATIGRRRGTV
jgi:hypothetical protein